MWRGNGAHDRGARNQLRKSVFYFLFYGLIIPPFVMKILKPEYTTLRRGERF